MHARVLSTWIYDDAVEAYRPQIEVDFPEINGISDMVNKSDIPPNPNVYVGFIATADNVINNIKTHVNYGVGAVLLFQEDEATVPSSSLFNANRAFVFFLGMETSQINAAIGIEPNNRTRWDISQELIQWLKNH